MNHYQEAMLDSIHKQFKAWLKQDREDVTHDEIYRFLHTVRGTSGTIGLDAVSNTAGKLMEELEASGRRLWTSRQLRSFATDLIGLASCPYDEARVLGPGAGSDQEGHEQPIVLVVDEDVKFLRYVKQELEGRGYMVVAATNPASAIDCVHDYRPHCVVLDLMMNVTTGFDFMLALYDKMKKQYIPTTVVSSEDTRANRIRAFRLGADDFVAKPLDMAEMAARLERQLGRKRLFDRLLRTDELTGALKRPLIDETLIHFLHRIPESEPYALAMTDINGLKTVNERYGSTAGDTVLMTAAGALRAQLAADEAMFRFDGDAFLLLLRANDDVGRRLSTAVDALSQHSFNFDSGPFHAGMTAGYVFVDERRLPLPHWIRLAEQAVASSKRAGRALSAYRSDGMPVFPRATVVSIVEEDKTIRRMLSGFSGSPFPGLKDAEIRYYTDGEFLLADEALDTDASHIVVLDSVLPRMNGFEVLQKLRSRNNSGQFAVLMLIRAGHEQDCIQALRVGADDYMEKPFGLRELEKRVTRLRRKVLP